MAPLSSKRKAPKRSAARALKDPLRLSVAAAAPHRGRASAQARVIPRRARRPRGRWPFDGEAALPWAGLRISMIGWYQTGAASSAQDRSVARNSVWPQDPPVRASRVVLVVLVAGTLIALGWALRPTSPLRS